MTTDGRDIAPQEDPPTHRFTYDPESETSVSTAVVRAVATVSDRSPQDIDPLNESIDAEALDQFVASIRGDDHGEVKFTYCGYEVAIDAKGVVEVRRTG